MGSPKVFAAASRLQALNSEVEIRAVQARLDASNVLDLLVDYDIVVDGSDNFATKYLLNDAAVKLGKPVVYGSILGFEGQAAVFWSKHGPCYRCLYPEPPKSYVPNCAEFGTLGGIAGLVGSVQVIEACKLALGLDHCQIVGLEPMIGRLFYADARSMETRIIDFPKKVDCPVCSLQPDRIALADSESPVCATSLNLADWRQRLADGQPFILLDVRQPAEWAFKHLPDALLIPLGELMSGEKQLEKLDSSIEILVYCQHGTRSRTAANFLRDQGFNALHLRVDWSAV
jgi:rhodanese-related sulfurtransferase